MSIFEIIIEGNVEYYVRNISNAAACKYVLNKNKTFVLVKSKPLKGLELQKERFRLRKIYYRIHEKLKYEDITIKYYSFEDNFTKG